MSQAKSQQWWMRRAPRRQLQSPWKCCLSRGAPLLPFRAGTPPTPGSRRWSGSRAAWRTWQRWLRRARSPSRSPTGCRSSKQQTHWKSAGPATAAERSCCFLRNHKTALQAHAFRPPLPLLRPPGVKDRDRHAALVTGTQILLLDQLGGCLRDFPALEVVVDLVVAKPEFIFVGAPRPAVQEVRRRDLLPYPCRRSQLCQQLTVLALVQAEQWQDVSSAVAVFGEEAGHGLGAVVRADDEVVVLAGQGVLGGHARPRLGISLVEVGNGGTSGLLELVLEAVHGSGNVEDPL